MERSANMARHTTTAFDADLRDLADAIVDMAARHPNHAGARRLMTVSLGLLEKIDEAREALTQTLELQPDLPSGHVANNTVYTSPSDRSRFLKGLRNAGLKH